MAIQPSRRRIGGLRRPGTCPARGDFVYLSIRPPGPLGHALRETTVRSRARAPPLPVRSIPGSGSLLTHRLEEARYEPSVPSQRAAGRAAPVRPPVALLKHCPGAARRSWGHAPDEVGPRVRIPFAPAESPREPDCRRGAGHRSTASLSAMVVNGWGPGAENADHGKNSKAERLLEEHRASERGYRSR